MIVTTPRPVVVLLLHVLLPVILFFGGVHVSSSSSVPTPVPTPSPSRFASFSCPAYSASNTASATTNTSTCSGIYACSNTTFSISGCGSCTGDQYIRLFNSTGAQVALNDDGGVGSGCGTSGCSALTYTTLASSGCQAYSLHEGCFLANACGGVMVVTNQQAPTPAPSTFYPTPSPGPTRIPSAMPSLSSGPTPQPTGYLVVTCPPYSTANTLSDTTNYLACSFYACPGATFAVSGCNSNCIGDQYLALADASGNLVASNDDGAASACGLCSAFTYTASTEVCQLYSVREGCFANTTCAGGITVSISGTYLQYVPSCLSVCQSVNGIYTTPLFSLSLTLYNNTLLISLIPTCTKTLYIIYIYTCT